jgi:hypothetical protein
MDSTNERWRDGNARGVCPSQQAIQTLRFFNQLPAARTIREVSLELNALILGQPFADVAVNSIAICFFDAHPSYRGKTVLINLFQIQPEPSASEAQIRLNRVDTDPENDRNFRGRELLAGTEIRDFPLPLRQRFHGFQRPPDIVLV